MTIPKITPYSGGVANPDGSQTQTEFTQNMFDQLSYEAELSTELNDTVDGINDTSTQVDVNATSAAQSASAAEAAASGLNYQGLWPDTGGIADKGDTYQTQVSGTPTGQYFTALQNTTVDPIGDDVNWREVVSVDSFSKYTDIVYKASGGNSAVENMISGTVIKLRLGDKCSTGGTSWKGVDYNTGIQSSYDPALFFKPLTRLNVNDFGASGDGVTNDESAIKSAIIYAVQNSIPIYLPSGDYNINGWSLMQIPSGEFSIVGDGVGSTRVHGSGVSGEILFTIGDNASIEGVSFESLNCVIYNLIGSGESANVTRFNINNCSFESIARPVWYFTYLADSTDVSASNVNISRNLVKNCGYGFSINTNITGYSISDNTFENIGIPNNISSDSVTGLSIGRDSQIVNEATQAQGVASIYGNKFFNFTNDALPSTGGVTNFIQCFGSGVDISGNSGNGLSNSNIDATDQEAIYLKGDSNSISNNHIKDAGDNEGSIKVKGSGQVLLPRNNVISGNTIEWTSAHDRERSTAIGVTNGSTTIVNNRITNSSYQCIVVDTDYSGDDKIIVSGNTLVGCRAKSLGGLNAILVKGGADVSIFNNIIDIDGQDNGDLFGVFYENTSSSPSDRVVITGNIVNLSNESASPTGSVRAVRFTDESPSVGYMNISNNHLCLTNCNRTAIGISCTITAPVRVAVFQCNTFDAAGVGSATDIIYSPPSTALLGYNSNTGFTTVLP